MACTLALDLGSTQLKLLLLDDQARVVYVDTQGYPTAAPRAGWIEQWPQDWLNALDQGMKRLCARRGTRDIEAVSFSGHMSGVVLLNRAGEVLYPCIMLADARAQEQCVQLEAAVGPAVRRYTGNQVVNAFSLPKLRWLAQNEPQAWADADVWLSPKDYLRYCLTGAAATEYTDAYNSLCIRSDTAQWCPEIILGAGLEPAKFPPVHAPQDRAGAVTAQAARRFGLAEGTPVFYGGADMACGAVGMALYGQGDSALTLGTCATFLAPVPAFDDACFGQVTFHLHAAPGQLYALGSHFNGGLAVNWIAKTLREDETLNFDTIRALAAAAGAVPPGSNGVMVLPWLAGSGSPYFCAADRQTVLGVSAATTRAELFRAELEGITLNLAQTLRIFDQLAPDGLRRVLLGGGGAKIGLWPQLIADVFGKRIDLAANTDASAVGAAILGGCGAGIFASARQTAEQCLAVQQSFLPEPARSRRYGELYARFLQLHEALHAVYAG